MKVLRLFALTFLVTTITTTSYAEHYSDTTEHLSFDFWVGEWDLTWDAGDGKIGYGQNSITKSADGKVINECFVDLSGGFKGQSITMYSPRLKKWKQTWMDNQGGYFDFEGISVQGAPGFQTKPIERKGKIYIQRMRFLDISDDSFTWKWENTSDGGKTWTLAWEIHYKRRTDKSGLNPNAPKETMQYGQLVGIWECQVQNYRGDSLLSESKAQWIFEYVLDGYAIQDYWVNPVDSSMLKGKQMHGTNIRLYNQQLNKWQCAWMENGSMNMSGVWLSEMKPDGSIALYDESKQWEILFYNITDRSFDWKWDYVQKDGSIKTVSRIKAIKISD